MELSGRVALITGGARRVGRAIALRLARAGCHIGLHYSTSRDEAMQVGRECTALGVQVRLLEGDLAESATPSHLIETTLERFGRLDILVNNASTFTPMSLEDFTPQEWDRTLRVNLTAPMALAFAARDALKLAKGRIINLCDIATQRPWPTHLAYVVSKGGLDTLTKALARAFAPDVNVVGIAPGIAEFPAEYDEALRQRLIARVPLLRAGSPDDIAAAVHFILGEGDYITGTILPVDGGRGAV